MDLDNNMLLVILSAFIGLLAVLLVIAIHLNNNRNLPPGPWNLPIIGYLPWLDPKSPYLTLTELSQKYGAIYGVYLGSVYTVVLSDAKLVKKTLMRDETSGRAPLHLTHGIMHGYGLICAEGDLWKDQRKFVSNSLRQLGATKIGTNRDKMEHLIKEYVQDCVKFIKNKGKSNSSICLDPLEPLRHSLGSIMNRIVLGKSWSRDDATWQWLQQLQEEGIKHIGVAGPLNFLPFLRFLPKFKNITKFLIDGKVKTHQIYRKIIDDYQTTRNNENTNKLNLIHTFLDERVKRQGTDDLEKFYNDQQMYHLLADIFGAGLDTTLSTLRWYLLYMATYPAIQSKVRDELRAVTANERELCLNDLSALPYVEASLAEVQRIRSVVPVGIPHGTLRAMDISGYQIPVGTMIVPLQWAIHMDPRVWPEPDRFDPERFIDEEGKFFRPDAFIPFQFGKRMCIGDELAKIMLFLFGATIIQEFKLERVLKDGPLEDLLQGDCGITLTPKDHEIIFTSV